MTSKERVPLRGKVARILNARELVINVGMSQGAQKGMRFDVLDPNGEDIRDPDTGERLGSLERTKIRVEVTAVEPKMAVAKTFRTRRENRGGEGSFAVQSLGRLMTPANWVTVVETLRESDSTWQELDESESFVKVGDPVIEVIEDREGGKDVQQPR